MRHGSHLAAALAGFALLTLASGLSRGKRTSWLLTLIVLVISATSHLLKGLDYEEALPAALLATWLLVFNSHFRAKSDPPSIRQGFQALAAGLAFTLFYGTVGFYILDRHFQVNFGWLPAIRQTLVMFTQFYDPGLQPLTGFGRYFAGSIYAVGVATLAYALYMLARPVLVRPDAQAEIKARARDIVAQYGRTSLARATLFNDKVYYFSPGGSLVAYALRGRIALALGDPIGPPDDLISAVTGYKSLCAGNDWLPVFYQTQPDTLAAYASASFDSLKIGNEAIVDLATFTLEGHANKSLRNGYNHMLKSGYHTRVHTPPHLDLLINELSAISQEWLASMQGSEKHFSLGWYDDDYIRRSTVMTVDDAQGNLTAFANLIPEYTRNETAIDLMRHRPSAEPGSMDFLFVELFTWAKKQGYATFNLGLSSLSGVGEHSDDPMVEKGLHFVYEHINQFYNFRGLHTFKEKFHPQWSPRYLIFPGPASLPAVLTALVLVDSGNPAPGKPKRD